MKMEGTMARVFIYFDDWSIEAMLIEICTCEGHEIVAAVPTVEETLQILHTTPLPVVAILEHDHSSIHPYYPLFPTLCRYPRRYARHRLITVHWWDISEHEQALLKAMDVITFRGHFRAEAMLAAVAQSAALLPE
jgi:hypothetical protein